MKKVARLSNLSKANRGTEVSVITASLPDPKRPKEIFQRAYQSLISQDSDYKWEWRIQVDGGEKELKKVKSLLGQALDDSRVKLCMNSRNLGQAITRNLALRGARGGAVVFLDDDDELTENAFRTWLEPLEKNNNLAWSAGQLLDAKNGLLTESRSMLPTGRIAAGRVFDYWLSPERTFPHPPSCFAVRTNIARYLGGWQALPQGEDFGWALSATFEGAGVVSKEPVYIYHKHKGNMRDRADFDDLESAVRNIVWDRAIELSFRNLKNK